MDRLSPAQRAIMIGSFMSGIVNPKVPQRIPRADIVRLDPMWNTVDQAERPPFRYQSGLGKKKKIAPFVNHQARYRKLKRESK